MRNGECSATTDIGEKRKRKRKENKRHLVERGNLGETIEREEERKESNRVWYRLSSRPSSRAF